MTSAPTSPSPLQPDERLRTEHRDRNALVARASPPTLESGVVVAHLSGGPPPQLHHATGRDRAPGRVAKSAPVRPSGIIRAQRNRTARGGTSRTAASQIGSRRSRVRIPPPRPHTACVWGAACWGYEFAISFRCRSELSRWSGLNGGNWMCSRSDCGTADQSYESVTVVRDGPVAARS